MKLFALTLMFGLLASSAYAEAPACASRYARLIQGLKALPGKAYKLTFKNTVNDYRRAWGKADEGRSYRLLNRFMFAPRVRERNPAKRAEELKKLQWFAALNEPVFDGAIELASQAWWRTGRKLGLDLKPFESNLSIPGGIAVSAATGYGTSAYLAEKAQDHFFPSAEEQEKRLEERDKLGTRYLAAWEELGILSDEQKVRANNYHVAALKAWGENLSSPSPHRPVPPRLYQLRLEGALRSNAEVKELETIALSSLREAQADAKANPRIKEDAEVKRRIQYKLQQSPLFKDRNYLEQQLLSMVLDPPVFLDGMVSNVWYSMAAQGDYEAYKNRRKSSDTYWLTQIVKNQKDPNLAKIREDFLKDPSAWSPAFLATYAALNFSPEAKKSLPQLREALLNRQDEK